MKETLVSFFGISEEHAEKIMNLDIQTRDKKIAEMREFRDQSKITFYKKIAEMREFRDQSKITF